MSEHRAVGKKSARRGRGAGVAVATGTALVAIVIGTQPAAAHAGTGAANRSAAVSTAAAEPGLGSGSLMQSEDFFQQGLTPVSATVDLTGKQALSACSGEQTMRALTKGKAAAYADVAWRFDSDGTSLTESAAEGSTAASATTYEKQLNAVVRDCQDEPAGHWYYGKAHTITVQAGAGTWYSSYNGDGKVAGGVAVIRSGQKVGIVELTGQPSDDAGYMAGIAAGALNRLAR
ncbi:hypothetical protein ACIRU8_00900 [Streptomyces sp. NPDC101175]|uniref:hypothetical protein n=1 Tax=Streptomyces sp. NPDC101175 TaxID=3366123 RepID=UPI0038391208